jgi:F0F1-type ATP synthase assembly protein I
MSGRARLRAVSLPSYDAFTARLKTEPSRFEPMSTDDQKNDQDKKTPWVQMANYAQLAIVFPAATLIGWLIGTAFDRWLHTSWLYLVGLIVGIIAGFVELIRTASANK